MRIKDFSENHLIPKKAIEFKKINFCNNFPIFFNTLLIPQIIKNVI